MKALAGWPARRPVAALSILVLLSAIGLVFAPWLPSQRLTPVSDAMVKVEIEMPGVDAMQVDSLIVRPLEDALAPLPDLRRIVTRANEGLAQVELMFSTITARDAALQDVRARVAGTHLPDDISTPSVEHEEPGLAPAVVYAVTGALSADAMQWADDSLRRPLHEMPETSVVTLAGAERLEVLVQPDLRRMASLGLSFDDLIQAVRGREEAPGRGMRRRTVAGSASVQAIAARAVRLPGGDTVPLAEVAEISTSYIPPASQPRHLGRATLLLHVYPRSAAQASVAAERANTHLAWLRANGQIPAGVDVQSLFDEAVEARQWRRELLRRIGFCVLTALASMSIFFGLRHGAFALGFLVAWGPLAAAALWVLGLTFNIMTALGLTLVLVPMVLAAAYPRAWKALAAVTAATAVASGVASVWWPFWRQVGIAFFVAASVAVLVSWLLAPWFERLQPAALARRFPPALRSVLGIVAAALVVGVIFLSAARVSAPRPMPADIMDAVLSVRLWGEDPARVTNAAHRLATRLRTMPGLIQVSDSTAQRPQWRLQLDAQALERFDITPAEVGRAFAVARAGLVIGDGLDGEKRMPLRLRLAPDAAGPAFDRLLLRGEQRQQPAVYLRDVGVTLRVNAPAEQLRIQRLPAAEVRASVSSSEVPAPPARLRETIALPEGYFLEWTGAPARGR